MFNNRLFKFLVALILILLLAHYFLYIIHSKSYMPFVLVLCALVLLVLNIPKDFVLVLLLTCSLAMFSQFVPSFGTLAPYVFLIGILFGKRNPVLEFSSPNLIWQTSVFVFLNALGTVILNPISKIQTVFNIFNLIICVIYLYRASCFRYSKDDLKLMLTGLGIMSIYLALTSINSYLGIIPSLSPLITGSQSSIKTSYAMSVLEVGSWDFFVAMCPLFLILLLGDRKELFNIKKYLLFTSFIAAVIGTLLIFSKTKTVILAATTIMILIIYLSTVRLKRYAYAITLTAILLIIIIIANTYFNLDFIFERFGQQPKLFKAVVENPLVAAGTTRDDAFYWGMKRNTERAWILGYGWDPWNLNKNAYFHNFSITHARADFHSLYYSIFPIFGWLGGIIFIYWLIMMVKYSYMIMLNGSNGYNRLIGTGLFALTISFLLSGYSSTFTTTPSFIYILFLWMGIIFSMHSDARVVKA